MAKKAKQTAPPRVMGRIDQPTWNAWHKAAEAEGLTFSAWCRHHLNQAAGKHDRRAAEAAAQIRRRRKPRI